MNQYTTEQSLLYISKLKNEAAPQTDEGYQEKNAQKLKVRETGHPAWPSVLLGMLNIIRRKHAKRALVRSIRSRQSSL
jgi:hypothetical protein